jgi:TPR repeat protein
MTCRLCAWINTRFSARSAHAKAAVWDQSARWERGASTEWELWEADSEVNHERIDQALALEMTQPEASFRLLSEAADAGSAWAMEEVGRRLETGHGTVADAERALDYYNRAVGAGSWMATLELAHLLVRQKRFDEAEAMLKQGLAGDFVPSFFWLARYRYERSPCRRTRHEVRPMLEHAADQGHPGAKLILARWMARGSFGIREIAAGFRMLMRLSRETPVSTQRVENRPIPEIA